MEGAAQQALLGRLGVRGGSRGIRSPPSRQSVAGQDPGTGLSPREIYSVLSGRIDTRCFLVGEIVGWFCSFLFPAPGSLWGRAGLAALGTREWQHLGWV